MQTPDECWLWRANNYEGRQGGWQACLGFKPESRFGGNEYIKMVPAPGEPSYVVKAEPEYTSLNDLPGSDPYKSVVNLDPTKYRDFYRNRDGNFAYQGEDITEIRTPRFMPNQFFCRNDVKGVHLTPFNVVVVDSEGKRYYLTVTNNGTGFYCRDIWMDEGSERYSQIHVLRLPQDHPATLLFVCEEIGTDA